MGSKSCGICGVAAMLLLAVPRAAPGSALPAGASGPGSCTGLCPGPWGEWVPARWSLGNPQPMPQLKRASSPWEGEGSAGREW